MFVQSGVNKSESFSGRTSLARPCFSRKHSNYYAVETYWFFKCSFLAHDWPKLVFVLFFCVLFLPSMFITILHNNTVNVRPSSPPLFMKIGPHFNTICFFLFWVFPFAFFQCFHIVLDLRVPSAPPPGPDWSHLWSMLVSLLFDAGRSCRTGSDLPVLAPRCTLIGFVLKLYTYKGMIFDRFQSILIRMCLLKQAHDTIS